jgi:hypothetical protein
LIFFNFTNINMLMGHALNKMIFCDKAKLRIQNFINSNEFEKIKNYKQSFLI